MITKKCVICKLELPMSVEFFATRKDRKTLAYQSSCRKCHKEYRKVHYENNKQKYVDKAKKYTKSVTIWLQDLKKTLTCSICNEDRWWVLDFHHEDPSEKEESVGFLSRRGSKKKLLEEITKCKVLCSNCHRDLHYKQRCEISSGGAASVFQTEEQSPTL